MKADLVVHNVYREEIILTDGIRLLLRPIQPADKQKFIDGFQNLSAESRYRRFLSAKTALTPDDLRFFTELDGFNHFALGIALLDDAGNEGEGVGVARFIRFAEGSEVAELAITVVDGWQHQGIGRLLVERLITAASERGIKRFHGCFIAGNTPIRSLIQHVCPAVAFHTEGTLVEAELPITGRISQPQIEPLHHRGRVRQRLALADS